MLIKKQWIQCTKWGAHEWIREGWFLFGIVPLYVRDCQPRGRIGRK